MCSSACFTKQHCITVMQHSTGQEGTFFCIAEKKRLLCFHCRSSGICLQVVCKLCRKRKSLCATLGVHHPPAQASPTLPSQPLDSGKLNSANLGSKTLPDPQKGEDDQQKEVADAVDTTANLVRLNAVCIMSRAVLQFEVTRVDSCTMTAIVHACNKYSSGGTM